jgi:hypothetical protein
MKTRIIRIFKVILIAQILAGLALTGAPALSAQEAPTAEAATDETRVIPETVSAGMYHNFCSINSTGGNLRTGQRRQLVRLRGEKQRHACLLGG